MDAIERIRDALQFIPADDRETWVRMAMAVKSELGDDGFPVWDDWSRQAESYSANDARDVWKSVNGSGGVSAGTLLHEARARGWKPNGTYQPPTPEELAERRRVAAKKEAEETQRHAEAATKARRLLEGTTLVRGGHPYCVRKGISPVDTLREIPASEAAEALGYVPKSGGEPLTGRLLVVQVSVGGVLSSVEMIDEAGRKSALYGGAKAGGYWAAQPLPNGNGADLTLLIGEGVATALSSKEATGGLAIAALSAGNLPAVAREMRECYPAAALVILADLVKATGEPDPHAIAAARAIGGRLAVPDFGENGPEDATDFNDLHLLRGAEAVREAIAGAAAPDGENGRRDDPGADNAFGVPDWRAAVERLAGLPPIEYDRCREREAKRLGARVTTLDKEVARARGEAVEETNGQGQPFTITEPEQWPEAVNGAALLDALAAAFRRFVVLLDHGYIIAALWTLHTYAFERGLITPILAVVSPDKGCGKTTLRDILAALVRAPLSTDGISASALFRVIEKWRPTILLDDFDSWGKDNDELRGVLNTGYRKGGVYVRCTGDDQEPRAFATFAPKCINLIGRLHPTLHDRSITITMCRKLPGERVESMHGFDGEDLQRKCARWVADNVDAIESTRPDMALLFNRQADNWRPLLAVAAVAGGEWPARATAAVTAALKAADDDAESIGVMLLTDLKAILLDCPRITSADLAQRLAGMEERPWPEYRNGKAITVRQIARLLKPFQIRPGTVRSGDENAKGYKREQFEDAFLRYLPGEGDFDPSHRHNVGVARVPGDFGSVTPQNHVTDKDPPEPSCGAGCDGVTDRITPPWETRI